MTEFDFSNVKEPIDPTIKGMNITVNDIEKIISKYLPNCSTPSICLVCDIVMLLGGVEDTNDNTSEELNSNILANRNMFYSKIADKLPLKI